MGTRALPFLATALLVLLAGRAESAPSTVDCEVAITKAAGKLSDTERAILRRCNGTVLAAGTGICPDRRAVAALAAARTRLASKIADACGGGDATCGTADDEPLASIGWDLGTCPSARSTCARPIGGCDDVADCLACNADAGVSAEVAACFGAFVPPSDAAARACQTALCKESFAFARAKGKALEACWTARARGRHANPCPSPGDGKATAAIATAESKMRARICAACGGADGQCGGADDVTVATLYGGPLACPAVTIPGGPSCAGIATTLAEVTDCLACTTERAVDCADALRVPWATAFAAECTVGGCAHTTEPWDLVFANIDAPNRLCEGSGTGTFTCRNVDDTAYGSVGVVPVDLDGDHDLDLVFANGLGGSNTRCLNDGAGVFACAGFSTPGYFTDVATADFDGDDIADVAFSRTVGGFNRVCRGDGTGGFTCAEIDTQGGDFFAVTTGDFNGDRDPDLVFANSGGGRSRICLGGRRATFRCADVSPDTQDSIDVAAGDLNGDGKLDLVFANTEQIPPVGFRNRVCLGDGAGAFTCSDVSSDSRRSQGVALGDVNGDGRLDAVIANFNQQRNRVCFGDGDGAFTCADAGSDQLASDRVVLADFDGDCTLDAVFASASVPTGERNRICFNNGQGGFACDDVGPDVAQSRGVAVGRF